jgi:ribosome recycling factor
MNMPSTTKLETTMPLSGEAIRTMNYVDDIATTLRRILVVLPALTTEERQRVVEHVRASEPSYESLIAALESRK